MTVSEHMCVVCFPQRERERERELICILYRKIERANEKNQYFERKEK